MKVKVRGFTKATLKQYNDVANNPLVAISPINQKELGVSVGTISVNQKTARLIDGKSDEFIGLTKTLRDRLKLENGQEIDVEYLDNELTIR